jgi:GT2 family glycosyltransferase
MRALKAGFRNLLEINATIYHKDAPKKPPHRMPYYFYLMARNQYFLWIENLKGLEKFSFSRKYIAKKLWECADFRRLGYDEWADACFDGTWAAIIGVGGRWDTNVRRPYLLKRILSWHPYFWARIFGANYLNIPSKILGGRKMRIFKMKA